MYNEHHMLWNKKHRLIKYTVYSLTIGANILKSIMCSETSHRVLKFYICCRWHLRVNELQKLEMKQHGGNQICEGFSTCWSIKY